ncbi:MAG: DNA repair protein RecO [Firmicutes bacterium]|nr:DNA repair protein RecO [Bacillota bacterium]
MKEIRTYGLVLHLRSLGEADKLVTLLTREKGKITAVARGSRKTKSKFSALLEPLTLGKFLLFRGKTLYTFIQGELIKTYTKLHHDLERLGYAQYFCELCERCLPEGEPAEQFFLFLLTALEALEQDSRPARVARCFEIGFLDLLGLRPALDACLHCGSQTGPFHFDPAQGGLLCSECPHPAESFPVGAAALAIMRRFLELGFYKLSVCQLPAEANKEIHQVSTKLLAHALGIVNLKSLAFLQQVSF